MKKGLVLAAALGSAGCELYANPSAGTCPGTPVATFAFAGTQTSATCAFAGPGGQAATSLGFTGTVAFAADGGAAGAACLSQDVPQARLNLGTVNQGFIDVTSSDTGAALNGCNLSQYCPTVVDLAVGQEIAGQIIYRDGGPEPEAFDGGMTTTVAAEYADGGSAGAQCCGPLLSDGGCSCGLPCNVVYSLTGATALPPP